MCRTASGPGKGEAYVDSLHVIYIYIYMYRYIYIYSYIDSIFYRIGSMSHPSGDPGISTCLQKDALGILVGRAALLAMVSLGRFGHPSYQFWQSSAPSLSLLSCHGTTDESRSMLSACTLLCSSCLQRLAPFLQSFIPTHRLPKAILGHLKTQLCPVVNQF